MLVSGVVLVSIDASSEEWGEDSLFTLGVKVDAADISIDLVEADVVEALEAGTGDCAHTVVGNEKVLLPAHKQGVARGIVAEVEVWPSRLAGERLPGRESIPMMHVDLFARSPLGMTCMECIFGANDFTFKIGREGWMFAGQA